MSNYLTSLTIDNFRAFDHLEIKGLSDVNIFVGQNNVGKTAIFEALVLLGQPCHIDNSLLLNEERKLKKLANDTSESWGLHFHNRNTDSPVRISAMDADGGFRELTIRLGQALELYPERNERPDGNPLSRHGGVLQQKVVRFDYQGPNEEKAWAIATVLLGELGVLDSTALPPSFMAPYTSTTRLLEPAASVYSNLVINGQEEAVLTALKSVFPEVTRLVPLTRANEPTLFASVDDGVLLPIQSLGDGATKVISWILIILSLENALLLIDEIDSGLHHSIMGEVFTTLFRIAKERNVQIVATTHSYEALEAVNDARHAVLIGESSVKVVRLQRVRGTIKAVDYSESGFEAAVANEVEVR